MFYLYTCFAIVHFFLVCGHATGYLSVFCRAMRKYLVNVDFTSTFFLLFFVVNNVLRSQLFSRYLFKCKRDHLLCLVHKQNIPYEDLVVAYMLHKNTLHRILS